MNVIGKPIVAENKLPNPASEPVRPGALDGCKMLFVAPDDYPAFRVDLVELFSNHLVSRGLRIDWSLRPARDGVARIDKRGNERFYVPRRHLAERFGTLRYRFAEALLRFKLASRAARGEYDIVQVRDSPIWGLAYVLAARWAGKPFVFWMSYPVLEARKRIALQKIVPMSLPKRLVRIVYSLLGSAIFFRAVLPLSDHVVVQSKRMRERVAEQGVPMKKMTPVPMGVSTERFNTDLIEPSNDPRLDGKKSFAYMSADVHSITTRLTFDALASLVADGHDAVLVIIGAVNDVENAQLAKLLAGLNIADRVIFTGRLPLPEALSYIRRADVCVSPFEMDFAQQVATPTKLVEYLAMGRPVVGTVHYDQCEVISSSGAGIVTAFSGAAIAEGIGRLFDNPEKAEAMGARGPGWVKENRDYAALADTVERIFLKLLDRRSSANVAATSTRSPAEAR